MRFMVLAMVLAIGCGDGVADLEVENPDELESCMLPGGVMPELCERACLELPPQVERTGEACLGFTRNGIMRECSATWRVNGELGCCNLADGVDGKNVARFYRCE